MSDYAPEFREPRSPLKAISDWFTAYRDMIAARSELATCGMEEVASVARDIGVSLQELEFAVQKGPHAAMNCRSFLVRLVSTPKSFRSKISV